MKKTTDKSIVVIGDIITFTLAVFNHSPIPTISTSVIDSIPAGTTFIENSVTINGTSVQNVRPDTGINIGSLSADTVATINISSSRNFYSFKQYNYKFCNSLPLLFN
ncbi:DUF11 domain-containing protein [Bacillus cereus]